MNCNDILCALLCWCGSYARATEKGKGKKKNALYYLYSTVILLAFILQKASAHRPFYRGGAFTFAVEFALDF